MSTRISKEQYYINIAKEVAQRSTCFRAKHGAIIVKDSQIIATGYVGAPRKTKDCLERGNCLRSELNIPSGQRYELCRSVHAEQNALLNAARSGSSTIGSTMYIYSVKLNGDKELAMNALPCFICKKMILNAGIDEVVCIQIDGTLKHYDVKEWVHDWQEQDIINDNEQYGVNK